MKIYQLLHFAMPLGLFLLVFLPSYRIQAPMVLPGLNNTWFKYHGVVILSKEDARF